MLFGLDIKKVIEEIEDEKKISVPKEAVQRYEDFVKIRKKVIK